MVDNELPKEEEKKENKKGTNTQSHYVGQEGGLRQIFF